MGFLKNSARILHNALSASHGELVNYETIRGGIASLYSIRAVFVESSSGINNEKGAYIRVKINDFLINVKKFQQLGLNEPHKGDKIKTCDGRIFEISPINSNEDAVEYMDHERTIYRIHTKKVS